jgi:DNA-binding MarR family transcriptional regulator
MINSEPLPKWIMRRYALLYKKFDNKKFTLEEGREAIKEETKIMLVLMSRLRKAGWINVEFDTQDARKRFYTLRPLDQVMEMMSSDNKTNNNSKKR